MAYSSSLRMGIFSEMTACFLVWPSIILVGRAFSEARLLLPWPCGQYSCLVWVVWVCEYHIQKIENDIMRNIILNPLHLLSCICIHRSYCARV